MKLLRPKSQAIKQEMVKPKSNIAIAYSMAKKKSQLKKIIEQETSDYNHMQDMGKDEEKQILDEFKKKSVE